MASSVQGVGMSTVGSRATSSCGVSTTGYHATSRGLRAPSQTVPTISRGRAALPGSSSPQVNFRQVANSSSATGYPTQGAVASSHRAASSQARHVAPTTPNSLNNFRSPLGGVPFPLPQLREHKELPRSDLQRVPPGVRMLATPSPGYRDITTSSSAVPSTPNQQYRTVCRSPPMQSRVLTLQPQQAQTPSQQFRSVQSPSTVCRSLASGQQVMQRQEFDEEFWKGYPMHNPGPPRAASKTRVALGVPSHRIRRTSNNYPPESPTLPARRIFHDPAYSAPVVMSPVMSPVVQSRVLHYPFSPGVRHRGVAPTADVSLTSPSSPYPRHEVRERSNERSVERRRLLHNPEQDDEMQHNIDTAMAMLPASPPNTLAAFLENVADGVLKPAGVEIVAETRIDAGRFWENRRVQNSLRRLLEMFQEHYKIVQPDELTKRAFDDMLKKAQQYRGRPLGSNLDEHNFSKALDDLLLWPPELSKGDKVEVFLALTVPNAHAVEHVWNSGTMMKELNLKSFQEGLVRVPYNLPDFPVPTADLNPKYCSRGSPKPAKGKTREVCLMIANVFSDGKTGLEKVKDFFLCGLLSAEEIQMSLDVLVPVALVDEAVMRIIRKSAQWMKKEEWEATVNSVRRRADSNAGEVQTAGTSTNDTVPEPASEPTTYDLSHQEDIDVQMQQRVVAVEPPTNWGVRIHTDEPQANLSAISTATAEEPSGGSFEEFTSGARTLVSGAQTEPMQTRELLKEEPVVNFYSPGPRRGHLCNWSTSQHRTLAEGAGSASDRPGNADEGAGTPQHNRSYLTDEPSEIEASASMTTGRRALSGTDPVAWVSLEMQNECNGPYLSRAFQKCCVIYQAKCRTPGFDDEDP